MSLRAALAVAAGVALLAVAAAFVPRRPAPPPTIPAVGLPAAWRLVNGTLTMLDEHERVVFRRDLGPSPPFAASSADRATRTTLVRIVDLDADGRPEVLVMPPVERRADSRLLCLESDGRLRFTDAPRGSVRFGGATFGEPWLVHGMFVTGSAGGRSVYASFAHGLWFPARLRRLDARGRLLEEYWSNGYVEQVAEVVWRGRKVLLVGGVGNDVKGGSLAIFDPPVAVGSAPSATEEHRCHGCPDGGPAVRLTFPTMCLLRAAGGIAAVVDAWTESPDRLTVGVLQGFADAETRSEGIEVFYTFGPDLSLVHVEVTAEFLARHARLERRGQLDHAFGARDEADMFPVRLFDAAGVRVVKPVSVSR